MTKRSFLKFGIFSFFSLVNLNAESSTGFVVTIESDICIFDASCVRVCPEDAIYYQKDNAGDSMRVLDTCTYCGKCIDICPVEAIW